MRKIDWFLVIVPLFLTWGLDRITKVWAQTLTNADFYGPVGFVLHLNSGAMLGLFSNTPPVIRIVSLATGGAFLLFAFIIVQYLLPIKSLTLRAGMSILLGGILGNVTDRILYGHVVDFILLGSRDKFSPAFNVADALQWVGYAMIAFALIKEGEVLWPAENSRKRQWINPKFQLRYCFILLAIGLSFAAIAGVYSYTFLRVTIIDFGGSHPQVLGTYLTPFIISYIAVTLAFAAMLFLIGKILSARIAGPIYAFELFLSDLESGKSRPLRLRAGDEFKQLEDLAARIAREVARAKADHGVQTSPEVKPVGALAHADDYSDSDTDTEITAVLPDMTSRKATE
ncbi:MAG: signal peptidase II [Proteobacteria bacterium]|nr:MAG: signal peptidase II [Pseudomonadota bacterium]